ncbi:hypothetical protein EES42_27815 [Streptomyces sp. ADI95-17]|nr:hypothetical protein EES42_27815 [Streptomyces sp. ADI95-17]
MDGTKWTVVTPCSRIIPARYCGSRWPSGRGSTRAAPAISGPKNSHTATSKLDEVFWSTRSAPVSGYTDCIQSRRLEIDAWETRTPFGRPVEPEV